MALPKRSRNGCLSCKRLRIKCNEAHPCCEYCVHTNRECVYPPPGPIKGSTSSSASSTPGSSRSRSKSPRVTASSEPIVILNPTKDLVLTQTTSQMDISAFELRLLHFFNHRCIDFFSFGVNSRNTWKFKVPKLLPGSDLVQQSIYSFSGMTLLSEFELTGNMDSMALLPYDIKDKLFEKTLSYFNKTLAQNRERVVSINGNEEKAKEVLISSILMLAFLGVHPYKLLPLISFDRSKPDLLTISRGIRTILTQTLPVILNTDLRELMVFKDAIANLAPSIQEATYPLIIQLLEDLDTTELPEDERKICRDAIQGLNEALFACMYFKFPIPLFRWAIVIPDAYRDLLYEHHEFAMRLLYVFSCLCLIFQFFMSKEKNMWIDHMEEYKKYNDTRYGGFLYDLDHWLFELGVTRELRIRNYNDAGYFDPKAEYYKA
ncbi:uncharacterized protein SPAPADRAFT_52021 [Spathaspora passalidarum NRRL Y-27907]|uniref:Zn(2)-C6 fungal-type domain-containing protein n=1 Tax=Spathaspora passalidarum (strain NRRL Y-27907 / 11-Y1) TaxID=619300 RepID=G3AT60_SPAPN|nr:uncharacterized protein SPAPADRAFT_52021 [Spathaspora passalidarum NRRL Y-27907]EGW30823.1 hypothetical protein SPAPADRAFT_52021 [Spathaspora passalidarum NRRL Y-27907]